MVLYCNGPFCGKSKRLAEELLGAGYTNVRRYQLGAPVWRALVGVMEIEPDGIRYVREADRTAVFFDVRSAEEFTGRQLQRRTAPAVAEVVKAKDDGRLPMEDHNTRIIVFGEGAAQARAAAAEMAKNAFHNVSFYGGSVPARNCIHLFHRSGLINEDDGLRHGPVTASFVTTSDGIGMELSGSCRDCTRGPALGGLIMTPSAATPNSTTSSHLLIREPSGRRHSGVRPNG